MHVDLAPGVTVERASRELVQYLDRDSKGPTTQYPPQEMMLMGMRRRDYWALALAEITGVSINLGFAMPEEEREARIRTLLVTVRGAGF